MQRKLRLSLVAVGVLALSVTHHMAASAAPIVLFQTEGAASDFSGLNLQTFGNVDFDVPLAKLVGRESAPGNPPLPDADRYANDFFGTMADDAFRASSAYLREQARGIVFKFGEFDNPSGTKGSQLGAGLSFSINVPEQVGKTARRVHLQFGKGKAAGGPAAIGGGIVGGGRKGFLRARVGNVPAGLKDWGQFINGQTFINWDTNGNGQLDPGEVTELRRQLKDGIKKRKGVTKLDDGRLPLYAALADRTQFVDPIESFYLDLSNDDGSAFDLDVTVFFFNNLFPNLAQFLDVMTLEIGEKADFPEIYDDLANNAFLGALPATFDVGGALADGRSARFTVGSGDVIVPLPVPALLLPAALGGLVLIRKRPGRRCAV